MIKLSHSQISKWLECRSKWYWLYVEGIESVDTSPELTFGKLWAKYNEGHYFDWYYADLPKSWCTIGAALAHAYTQYYSDQKLVFLEREFGFDLSPELPLIGYFDAIVEYQGKKYIFEQKTTGQKCGLDQPYWDYKKYDQQAMLYLLAARSAGLQVEGVLFDVVQRFSSRPKSSESEEQFYDRMVQRYTEETPFVRKLFTATPEQLDELSAEVEMIHEEISQKKVYKNRGACYNYRRECEFAPLCWEGASSADSTLYKLRKTDR